MISVITCSVSQSAFEKLQQNVAETIGVPFEMIRIDNSDNRYGICEAYNIGGSKAKYPVFCFVHEDLAFETQDWGAILVRQLADPDTGLIGIAGGDAKSLVPSSWSSAVHSNEINLVQYFKSDPGRFLVIRTTGSTEMANGLAPVVALDGVCLFTKKEVFTRFKFDQLVFPGFHGYDLDYSLQVGTAYKLYVTFEIIIHHFSEGSPDKKWIRSAINLSKKWKHQLPVSVYQEGVDYKLHHWKTVQVFMQKLIELDYHSAVVTYYLFRYSFNRFFSVRRFLSMSKYVTGALLERFRTPQVS